MTVPDWLAAVLPPDARQSWELIAPVLPNGLYLAGGTGLAVHLRHRTSRDLDFFHPQPDFDVDSLTTALRGVGPFAVSQRSEGTLNGTFSETRLQILSAVGQRQLEPTTPVAGIEVAGLSDILAMKLKVIGDRGELRDYFDLMRIEQQTGRSAEEGIGLYMARYDEPADAPNIRRIVGALGYLDDIDEDQALPVGKEEIATYWRRRQPELVRNLARFPPPRASGDAC